MPIERRLNKETRIIELWEVEWENMSGQKPRKKSIKKYRDEQTALKISQGEMSKVPAICWSSRRTLGNIAVYSQNVLGKFPNDSGTDAILPCDIVDAGKFRYGAERWWCRTHQVYWGTKADQESFTKYGEIVCASHTEPMNYVVGPQELNVSNFPHGGIWCSMPPALSSEPILKRPPKIHVHVRNKEGGTKTTDQDFDAISVRHNEGLKLFHNQALDLINVTPTAAFEFVRNIEKGIEMDCIACSKCGYPHLDLGDFGKKPHIKHTCANCGFDSTRSKKPIISTPLKPLHDVFPNSSKYTTPNRSVNIDKYTGYTYEIWPSTPAIIWKAERPQDKGIHVHIHKGEIYEINETFSEVILNGEKLSRSVLFEQMLNQTVI